MTRLGRAGFTLLPLCIGLANAASARAQEAETVWLVLPECATPPYDPSELSKSLEVELAPYHLRAQVRTPDSTEPGTSVSVGLPRCDADSRWLTLQYGDAVGRRSRKRALSLRDVPRPARARMLALVIAYALRPARSGDGADTSPAAAAPNGEPRRLEALAPATADPVRVDTLDELPIRNLPLELQAEWQALAHENPLRDTADAHSRLQPPLPGTLRLGAGAEWRLLTADSNLLFGIEVNLRGHLLGRSEWVLEGGYSSGSSWVPERGLVDLAWWQGGLGVDYPLTDAPCVRLGPRVALGRLESFGEDVSTAATLTTLGGRASFSARLGPRASLDVQFEVDHSGYVLPLTSDGGSLPWYGWIVTWGAGFAVDI